MTTKTGYLAAVFNLPPLVFRFQFNPDVLAEKSAFTYEQAANFGRYEFDKTSGALGGGFGGAVRKLAGLNDDIKELGSILTATRPLEAGEGKPRVFQIDFALDSDTGDGTERRNSVATDLQILRAFMNPALDAVKTSTELFGQGRLPCYKSPPLCTLKYGGLSVECVMTALNIKMTRFADDGQPDRAECTVTLKEQTYSSSTVINTIVRDVEITVDTVTRPDWGQDWIYAGPAGSIVSALD